MIVSMARGHVFKEPRTTPPASGWEAGHRPPALGYGQLDGICIGDGEDWAHDNVSPMEHLAHQDIEDPKAPHWDGQHGHEQERLHIGHELHRERGSVQVDDYAHRGRK